jgi:uncharacterized protein DUF4406
MRIYVAGPYTKGDTILNIRKAIFAGNFIAHIGHTPFIPHLTGFWQLIAPHEDVEFWYRYDNEWLTVCDALVRLDGESVGSDKEVELAKKLGLIIFKDIFDIPRLENK